MVDALNVLVQHGPWAALSAYLLYRHRELERIARRERRQAQGTIAELGAAVQQTGVALAELGAWLRGRFDQGGGGSS